MTVSNSSDKSTTGEPRVRVMVVDDSGVIRGFISRTLEGDPGFKVIASASNGRMAIDMLKKTPADVIILDIEMPVMDGLTAIPKLKEVDPAVQIVMASTLTTKNAEISLKALSLGATDYLAKPSAREMAVPGAFQRDLREKVKQLAQIAVRENVRQTPEKKLVAAPIVRGARPKPLLRPMPNIRPAIIAIGSSTGGPQALFEVIRALGPGLAQPIVITQHMPPAFTTILAEHINKQCGVDCIEAKDGAPLVPGRYHIAPGDFHMIIKKSGERPVVQLTQDAPENFCRPAIDPMLRSLVPVYGRNILVTILTGMGTDGCKGAAEVVNAGGAVIAQDEESSVVWGMPGAVASAGLCSAIVPVMQIGGMIRQIATVGAMAAMQSGGRE